MREAIAETAAERDRLREQVEKLNLDLIRARLERGEMRKQRYELLAACKIIAQRSEGMRPAQDYAAQVARAAIKHAQEQQ